MKKSLKALAIGAAIIPCALAMTACGEEPRLVDTSGHYNTTSSYSEVQTHLEEENLNTDLNSYQLVMKISGDVNLGAGSPTFGVSMKIDNIFQISDDLQTLNSATTMDMTVSAGGRSESQTILEEYIQNNTHYARVGGVGDWSYQDLPTISLPSYEGMTLDFSQFESLTTLEQNSITVTIDNSDEDSYKVKMVLNPEILSAVTGEIEDYINQSNFVSGNGHWGQATMYYIFENNEFVGAAMDTTITLSGATWKIQVDFAEYNGTIDFPSFN